MLSTLHDIISNLRKEASARADAQLPAGIAEKAIRPDTTAEPVRDPDLEVEKTAAALEFIRDEILDHNDGFGGAPVQEKVASKGVFRAATDAVRKNQAAAPIEKKACAPEDLRARIHGQLAALGAGQGFSGEPSDKASGSGQGFAKTAALSGHIKGRLAEKLSARMGR